jgi:hypothetical protein
MDIAVLPALLAQTNGHTEHHIKGSADFIQKLQPTSVKIQDLDQFRCTTQRDLTFVGTKILSQNISPIHTATVANYLNYMH